MIGSPSSWRRRFLSRACSWRLHEAKQSQTHNNPSSQVETHGYLILETGAWDRRIVAPTFFAFFRLSVALNRMSLTNFLTVSPHPNINPAWSTPAHRTGRDPQSTNTRDCRREKSKSTAESTTHGGCSCQKVNLLLFALLPVLIRRYSPRR